jgi:Uma2 family endonuclease
MVALAGTSEPHNRIIVNIARELSIRLRGMPCKPYVTDLRVRVSDTGLYTYPDALVVCGKAEFIDDHTDTLTNPAVIFEVLSPSTEAYDRGEKFSHYRRLHSLRDYVLVAQDRCGIEHYTRQAGNLWLMRSIDQLGDGLDIATIGCSIPVADIYEDVTLSADN